MKKKLFLILCIALSLSMLTACGRKQKTPDKIPVETSTPVPTATPTPVPTVTPSPTPEPTKAPVSTPTPVQIPLPKISKEPADETVTANGSCTFIAQCDNATLAEWHFISPDGSLDVSYSAVQNQFPALKITGGNTKELKLEGVPELFNGVKVYCKFSNEAGSVNTSSAQIIVKTVAPTALYHGFVGSWVDEATGIWIDISYKTEGSVNVNVCWSNSTWQRTRWQMMAYVYQDGIMVYDSCHSWIETGVDGFDYTITSESHDGTGSFYIKDRKLHWYNDLTGQLTVLVPA
jgi:predicted small lipoprotein YifL